jgi:hypothetical protein
MSKKRNKIDGPFVPLLHDLIQSDAYKLLSSTAKIAFQVSNNPPNAHIKLSFSKGCFAYF